MELLKGKKHTVFMIAIAAILWLALPERALADTAGGLLSNESAGASIVFNINAYNNVSLDNLGIEMPEEVPEIESSDLVMVKGNSALNMRAGKGTEYAIIGKMYKDCGGQVLEREEDGWSLVQSGDVIGYCNSKYLLFDEDATKLAKKVGTTSVVVKTDCLCVRADASDDAPIIGYAVENDYFELIYEEGEEWMCIAFDQLDGFVKAEFVKMEFQIDHGESMEAINERKRAEQEKKDALKRRNEAIEADDDTLKLLANLIYCEARGEPYEGQVAVGAVVMNRLRSKYYPNTIYGVIFASGQFSPAMSGSLQRAYENDLANPTNYAAAQEALDGYSNVGDMTHFRRKGKKEGYIIGNHVFY